MYAVTFETAVTEDLPGFHAGEGVLDACTNLLVGGVVRILPVRQSFALAAAVRHHKARAGIASVSDGDRVANGSLGTGLLPRLAVVAVAWQRPSNHDNETGIGVDDDLVVGGVPIVLRLLSHLMVTGGHQGAVHDEDRISCETAPSSQSQQRTEMADDAADCGLRDPEERCELPHRQVGTPVGQDEQGTVLQGQAPGASPVVGVCILAPHRGDQLGEAPRAQPGERGYP